VLEEFGESLIASEVEVMATSGDLGARFIAQSHIQGPFVSRKTP